MGNRGRRDPRLAAVAAVFAAQTASGVDEQVQVHPVAEPATADPIGGRQAAQIGGLAADEFVSVAILFSQPKDRWWFSLRP